jgi:hypothetical protein
MRDRDEPDPQTGWAFAGCGLIWLCARPRGLAVMNERDERYAMAGEACGRAR